MPLEYFDNADGAFFNAFTAGGTQAAVHTGYIFGNGYRTVLAHLLTYLTAEAARCAVHFSDSALIVAGASDMRTR